VWLYNCAQKENVVSVLSLCIVENFNALFSTFTRLKKLDILEQAPVNFIVPVS
jgi:hypothetical protein